MRLRPRDLLAFTLPCCLLLLAAALALALPPDEGEVGPGEGPPGVGDSPPPALPGEPPEDGPSEPPSGPLPLPVVACPAGFPALAASDVNTLALAAAGSFPGAFTVAVVDRGGAVLALFQKPGAPAAENDRAVALARTAAFFSHDQAPLSSRTVRFLSGVHFPPGVARAANAALYGIENTNRGCDLNAAFNAGKMVAPATSVNGLPCAAGVSTAGCGPGPRTGKPQPFDEHAPGAALNHRPSAIAVDPGGVPIYRNGRLVGGIGVAGALQPDQAELAALAGIAGAGLAPVPRFPLPAPGAVFIDGVRLPFVKRLTGAPGGGGAAGVFALPPQAGGCAPEGDLVGPAGGLTLTLGEVQQVLNQAIGAANRTRGVIRLPLGSRSRMVIAVTDPAGKVLALHRMADATVFSIDVAVAKARNVVHYSTVGLPGVPPGTAVTNRTIGFGAQPLFPPGIDGTSPGPFFGLFQSDLANPCAEGGMGANTSGIVFFAGSIPLYKGNTLVGGLGVSGDGVEQDDYVSFKGAQGFLPPEAIRADQIRINGVRLPFLKFPRNPEG